MITREALYQFIEALIDTSDSSKALFESFSFRNLKSSVDSSEKVVRVECFTGMHNVAGVDGDKNREMNVQTTIQCWVTPEDDTQEALDTAADTSFEMSREIFDAIRADTHLGGFVCNANFEEFETGDANLGATRRGVTYLDGIINNAQEG